MLKRATPIALALLLAGCAASGPLFTEAAPPQQGKVLFYVYRTPAAAFAVRSAGIILDGQDVCDLDPMGYCFFYVAAGHHTIQQRWHYWPGDLALPGDRVTVEADVSAGETHYFRFATGSAPSGLGTEFQWMIAEVPEGSASEQIATMRYQAYSAKAGLRF
jgi:hypothetical protein